jgi:hypothetical protein
MMGKARTNDSLLVLLILIIFGIQGCAGISMPTRSNRVGTKGLLGSCADFFNLQDEKIVSAKVLDAEYFRIEDYPYLRINRFLASFAKDLDDPAAFSDRPAAFSDWMDQLQLLDQKARQAEIANLSGSEGMMSDYETDYRRIVDCGNLLKRADFKMPKTHQRLRKAITVPDEYIDVRRVLGIYPLTGWFISRGVSKWHTEARKSFSLESPSGWQKSIRYSPPKSSALPTTERIASFAERDALGIPKYTAEALKALFEIHAPVWEVETKRNYDRIGAPFWAKEDELQLNTDTPTTYTLLNFTRFEGKIMTQLNYVIWFPSRPKSTSWDIYGGRFDGINFRVTLNADGTPLLYETIHNCGCYYKAYPTEKLRLRAQIDYAEQPLIFKAPPINNNKEIMVVAMESRNHYVRHLYARPRQMRSEKVYVYLNYHQLRSLPLPINGKRSMFRQDGIVHGTERLERFILWPSGVGSPGAMRQWGRHAVTLVGKRHFDDPFYIEKIFKEK